MVFAPPIPSPIDDLIDYVFKELKYDAKVFKMSVDENQVKELMKQWVLASHCRGENVSLNDIVKTMKVLADLPPDQMDVLKNMSHDLPARMSLKQGDLMVRLIAKTYAERAESELSEEKLNALTMVMSRDPLTLKDNEKDDFKKELKNAFKSIIKALDKENKLSPEQQDKLADECMHKFIAKPTMDVLKEIIHDVKKELGVEVGPRPVPGDRHEEDSSPEAMLSLPPPSEIKLSDIPAYTSAMVSTAALVAIATKPDFSSPDYTKTLAHIASFIETHFPVSGDIKALCEAGGIGPETTLPRPAPPGIDIK